MAFPLLPSSVPSYSSPDWIYDVFPSFHTPDVRRSFLGHILNELRSKGINSFIENNDINRGRSTKPELIEAIRGSKIAIVMLSRNYASSYWCLDELVEIMKCRVELGQRVIPIFYHVDPADVRKLTGPFGKVFRHACKGKTKQEFMRWRQALVDVSTIAGYRSSDWDTDAGMIEKIVYDILENPNYPLPSSDFEDFVGMEAHIEKMESLLCLDLDEVRMIGICGPHGIGKTTIARCLFNKHSHQFHSSIFLDNVKHSYARTCHNEYNTKLRLQNQFLSLLLNQRHTGENLHMEVAQEWLKDKKMLVVLNDVDSLAHLDVLAKARWWFGPGSRIIIATQEPRLLKARGINHIYKVDFPPPGEALQIFCMYAFGQKFAKDVFVKLAREATRLSSKLPLELRHAGSYLKGNSREEWELALPRLRTVLDQKMGRLTTSTYNSCSKEKEISHRHISCLGDGEFNEGVEEDITKGPSELRQDLKENLYTRERACQGISDGSPPAVYIYCPNTLQFSFATHLTMDFSRKGISAFVKCNEILDVIEGASASVVVFSKNCLSSTSCLDKPMGIFLRLRRNGSVVVPVFYGTSPSHFRMQEHDTADWIEEWGTVLQELGELRTHHSREECNDCELVEEVVKDVYTKLFPTQRIGINSRLLEIEQLLCKQPWGIRSIGIWGMPGIGKTTLAKAVFDNISGGFEASCFIKHFDEAFHEKGIYRLLEEQFGNFFKELPRGCSSITRPNLPGDSKKRVLVVLDDVQNPLVAESFLRAFHWFGPGSLIIITSRDKQVFRLCQIDHVYEVQSLNQDESRQLFSQYAFGKYIKEQDLLPPEVVDYADGNPLAIRYYGRELKGKEPSEMKAAFLKLKLRTQLHGLFSSSYETLDENEKKIFLDIACFFNGEKVAYVMQLLEGCGFFPHVGIDVLLEKCLVTISEKRVKMRRIIQDFGREIINGETEKIERRRRLWEPLTIKFLLEEDTEATYTSALGSEDIEGIFLDISNILFDVKPAAFINMLNLRFLKIYCPNYENLYGLCLPKGLQSLPNELRLLRWDNYPLASLPQDFEPDHLIELNLSYSHLHKLWRITKNLPKLKMVRLCHSQQLTKIDDINTAQNIELIDLEGCIKLQSFPATGQLQHLRVVNLSGCREIKSFPEFSKNIEELDLRETGIGELLISTGNPINLKKLYLSGCTSLMELPSSIGNAVNLQILDLRECSRLEKLPSSIGNVTNLEELNLEYCSSLVELPSSIGNATNLKKLYLRGCASLMELPSSIGNAVNLQILDLRECSRLEKLPSSIGNVTNLEELNLEYCSSLVELPSSIGNAINLKKLYLSGCASLVELPSSIGNATNLEILDLGDCSSLKKLPSSNLEKLSLEYGSSLMELPSFIGKTSNLKKLCLTGCSSLIELPSSIENATSLQELNLEYCSSLVELPSLFGNAKNLKELYLTGCSRLVKLPSSIGNFMNLKILDLSSCSSLRELPSSIGNATNLEILNLEYCSSLVELPSSLEKATKLKKLCLAGCSSLVELPSSIRKATYLPEWQLETSSSLVALPSLFGNATTIKK